MHTPHVPHTPAELARALEALEPRAAALLRRRLLENRSAAACASLYGVSPAALEVHLLRACLALEVRLGAPAPPAPRDEGEETCWARRLAERLAHPGPPGPGAQVAAELRRLAPQVLAELAAAEAREVASPERRREEWLRRAGIALLLGFTAWYLLGR